MPYVVSSEGGVVRNKILVDQTAEPSEAPFSKWHKLGVFMFFGHSMDEKIALETRGTREVHGSAGGWGRVASFTMLLFPSRLFQPARTHLPSRPACPPAEWRPLIRILPSRNLFLPQLFPPVPQICPPTVRLLSTLCGSSRSVPRSDLRAISSSFTLGFLFIFAPGQFHMRLSALCVPDDYAGFVLSWVCDSSMGPDDILSRHCVGG